MVCLRDLSGFWRRTLIASPDGRPDTETEVFWLQGPSRYADLRVPAGRPAYPDVTGLRDLNWTMLRFMARQEGFFGYLDIVASVGQWHREFDYRPDTGIADRGALALEDGILVERGIDLSYVEHWERQSAPGDVIAFSLTTETGTTGSLVVVGDAFIYARGRAASLPRGVTLDQLIDSAASLKAAQDLFDCEISFGFRRADTWCIERSSHCFREGATLSPALDSVAGFLVIDDVTPEGTRIQRTWRITWRESTNDAHLSVWFGSEAATDALRPLELRQDMKKIEPFGASR